MLRKLIHPILVLPFCLYINSQKALLSKANNNIEEILQENENQIFLYYSEIDNITLKNNQGIFWFHFLLGFLPYYCWAYLTELLENKCINKEEKLKLDV